MLWSHFSLDLRPWCVCYLRPQINGTETGARHAEPRKPQQVLRNRPDVEFGQPVRNTYPVVHQRIRRLCMGFIERRLRTQLMRGSDLQEHGAEHQKRKTEDRAFILAGRRKKPKNTTCNQPRILPWRRHIFWHVLYGFCPHECEPTLWKRLQFLHIPRSFSRGASRPVKIEEDVPRVVDEFPQRAHPEAWKLGRGCAGKKVTNGRKG